MSDEETEKRNGGVLLGQGEGGQRPGVSISITAHLDHFRPSSCSSSLDTLGFMATFIMVWPLAFPTLLGVLALESVIAPKFLNVT